MRNFDPSRRVYQDRIPNHSDIQSKRFTPTEDIATEAILLTGTRPAVPQNNNNSSGTIGDEGANLKKQLDPKEENSKDPQHQNSGQKVKQKQQDEELARQKRMAGGLEGRNSSSSFHRVLVRQPFLIINQFRLYGESSLVPEVFSFVVFLASS